MLYIQYFAIKNDEILLCECSNLIFLYNTNNLYSLDQQVKNTKHPQQLDS